MKRSSAAVAAMVVAFASCALLDGLSGPPATGPIDAGDRPADAPDAGDVAPDAGELPEWSAAGWHRPVALTHGGIGEATGIRVAMDSRGRAFAAYASFHDDVSSVWLATKAPDDADWTEAPVPHVPDGSYETTPRIAAAPDGAVVAFASSHRHLYAARFGDDLSVPPSAIVRVDGSSPSPRITGRQSLAVNEDGVATLVWASDGGYDFSRSVAGTEWDAARSFVGGGPYEPADVGVAVSGDRAVFGYVRSGENDGMIANLNTTPVGLVGSRRLCAGSAVAPELVVVPGRAWFACGDSGYVVLETYTSDWAITPTFVPATGLLAGHVAFAANADGDAVAAWRRAPDGDPAAAETWASATDGLSWSEPVRISAAGAGRKAAFVDVAIDAQGGAVAAWVDLDEGGTFARVWANVLTPAENGVAWAAPAAIDVPNPRSKAATDVSSWRPPFVARAPSGSGAVVVWSAFDAAGREQVWSTWRR